MPAPANPPWATGTWDSDAWAADTWGPYVPPVAPDITYWSGIFGLRQRRPGGVLK